MLWFRHRVTAALGSKWPVDAESNSLSGINVLRLMNFRSLMYRVLFTGWLAATLLILSGCSGKKETPGAKGEPREGSQPLVLLVVDDPLLGEAVAREWRGRTEQELTVRNATPAEIASAKRLPGDCVVFPGGLIGQLAERGLIVPLAAEGLDNADFNYRDIFDQLRLREMKWGDKTFAAALGSPQLLLAYRADILEKLQIAPPATWAEYQKAVAKLGDRAVLGELAAPADQPWHATIEPLAEGWAGQLLLARAAAYAMHRDQVSPLFRFDSLAPLVDQPPYVRALEELVAAGKAATIGDQRLTPQAIFAELRDGHCAMALTWAAPEIGSRGAGAHDQKIRFALLPGATQAYRFATKSWENRGEGDDRQVPLLAVSGRMAAVSATTAEPQRAESFVLWLAGREVSEQVGPHSAATTLFRNSQIAASGRWTGSLASEASRQYAEVLAQSLNLPRAFPGLTIPGRAQYLAALDQAVDEALAGKPSAEALAGAAKRWTAITEELGLLEQKRANARSLGQAGP
jgi:multiple sugar transport system substrate-binding protein